MFSFNIATDIQLIAGWFAFVGCLFSIVYIRRIRKGRD